MERYTTGLLADLDRKTAAGIGRALPGTSAQRRWEKAEREARFDGLWVLQTDLEVEPAEVAPEYKELWEVEALFRQVKAVLKTRPIYHQRDDTIRGPCLL